MCYAVIEDKNTKYPANSQLRKRFFAVNALKSARNE